VDGVVGGHVAGVQRDHDVERRRVVIAHIALLVVHAFELELADDTLAQLHQLVAQLDPGHVGVALHGVTQPVVDGEGQIALA
jgi:hypothetical protein